MKRGFIKALGVAAAAILAALPSYSEDLWFDAGIKDYSKWPPDECPGTWSDTSYAELAGEEGARRLLVSAPQSAALSFAADGEQTVGADVVTVRTATKMSVFDAPDSMEAPVAEAKCAISAVIPEENGEAVYVGIAKDAAGGTNVWVRLAGAVPDKDATVLLGFDIKEENGVKKVRYSVDGTVLKDEDGNEWLESVFTGEASDKVSTVVYSGEGEVASLGGYTEKTVPLVGLTIPAAEHMTVASVKVGGVPVEARDGVYYVPQGAVVSVRFTPDTGWALSKTTVKIRMDEKAMEFPSAELPSAISVGETLRINEIMASNGSSLTTKNGTAEIDWVELYNSSDDDINLAGWYMGNDPAKPKPIEGECIVPAKGFKIVWFDGDGLCKSWAADEAHVNANVSTTAGKHTVFLSPTANAADIIQQIKMPGMMKDVSYGIGHLERNLLGPRDAAQYRAGEGEWKAVRGPLGMSAESSTDAGFTVTSYKLSRQLTSVDIALAAIRDQAWKSGTQPQEKTGVKTIAYRSNGQAVDFLTTNYSSFPVATEDLAVVVKGTVVIPESGLWTFSVGSDDGFRLTLANEANSYSMEYPGTRGYGQTYSAFNMDAGAYNLELVYFDRNGGAALDLSVAKGDFTTVESGEFNTTDFHLIGAEGCPVLFGGALAGSISTDVKEEMLGKASTLDWTASFAVPADDLPAEADTVLLKVRYADGLVAKLNGSEIARTEVAARTAAETLAYATFEINPALVKTENTLEISVTNDKIDDSELYLEAQVTMQRAEDDFVYFRESTPGAANTTHGFGPMTPAVGFSEQHGYKTEPFELSLSCAEAPYAPIYYTTDGTSPTEKSTLYTGPITISKTTCIRAAVPQDNTILQKDCAATYLFLEDILQQSPDVVPEGFPADGAVNKHAMRYGFSAKGLQNDPERLLNGFTGTIATVSIVIDPKSLFDKANGIYVNPSGDGRSWERQMMLEQINPTGDDDGFSVPAGIRIRGAASRGTDHAKHSFRFFFRGEYGMGSLEYSLFGKEGVDEFDKVDLRCSQNYSWANENSSNETFIHECFSRDSQGAMGDYYTKSRYYNLFINGQYWGLYQTEERGDEDFAASYNGGASGNYDVIKTSSPGYNTGASEGTEDAWKALWEMIVNTADGEKNYHRAMGLNEDGTRNEDYPVYLNPTNLINYVLNFHFVCDSDAPISMSGFVNNLYAVRNRVDGDGRLDGFYFLRHDAEHSMGVRGQSNATVDPTVYGTEYVGPNGETDKTHGPEFLKYTNRFSPAELFWRLTKNDEFKMLVADLYYKHLLKEGGALTAPVAKARFEKRMAEIDSAIVAEAARWSKDRANPWTYAKWQSACNGRLTFIDNRGPYMLSQYRARGWYPSIDVAKAVDGLGETITDGTTIGADERVYLTSTDGGTVYYTTDGSDPRAEGGAVAASAKEYEEEGIEILPTGATIAARVLKDGEWSAIDTVRVKGEMPKSTPAEALRLAAVYSSTQDGDGDGSEFIVLTNVSEGAVSLANVKLVAWNSAKKTEEDASLTIAFTEATEILPGQSLTLDKATWFGAKGKMTNSEVGLKIYANDVCIQEARVNANWWNGACDGTGAYFLAKTFGAEAKTHADWMPTETTLAGKVAVAELYTSTSGDGGDVGEYIVLTNLDAKTPLDLTDVKIVAWNAKKKSESEPSLVLTLVDVTIPAGGTVTLDQETYFGDGKLTNSQVGLKIYDQAGGCAQEVGVDASWWDKACDGTGASFEALEFGALVNQITQWQVKLPPAPKEWPENPDEEITDDTKPSDLGITEGAFAEATTDELRKLAKWAKSNDVAFGGAAVNAMAFDEKGNPATVLEEAYLLNCAPTDVAEKKAEFKFDAIEPGSEPVIDGDFNGTVTVLGSATLGPDADWTPNNPDARFYKAVLTR